MQYLFGKATVTKDFWFFDHVQLTFGNDPIPVLKRLNSPVLIIGKDTNLPLQTSLGRLVPALSGSGNKSVIEIFPNAGHDLRVEPGKGEPWDFPRFEPGYLELLVSWVKLQTATDSDMKRRAAE